MKRSIFRITKTSKNLLFYQSNKTTNLYVKINIFRTQKLSQRLTNVRKVFIQGTYLTLDKNNEPCNVLACSVLITLFLATCILENC